MTVDPCTIVGIRYLNSRPLLAGLEAGIPAPFPYRFLTGDPSACADRLATGEAVAGLVPVAVFPTLPGVRMAADLGVACKREAGSVLLVSRVPLRRITTLAAHAASRTSVVLARMLLAEVWGTTPRVTERRTPLDAFEDDCDAAVVIGDPALELRGRTGFIEVDLGAAWVEWTGLPFVFAVWGALPEAPPGVGDLVEESHAFALAHWDDLLPNWAHGHGVTEDAARRYLQVTLHHRLEEAEHRAVDVFLARATAAGLLPPRPFSVTP